MPVSIIQIQNRLSPAALTIRAQTVSPIDNGKLHWAEFFPEEEVLSSRWSDISTVDFRPVASRRPWDALGRQLPQRVGKLRDGDMTPIESWFAINEQEIQRLGENTGGNAAVVLDAIEARVPQRVDKAAMACWRTVELDSFNVWFNGFIRVTDPDEITSLDPNYKSKSYDVDFGIDPARYPAAPSSYASATNAYEQFRDTFIRPANDATGGIEGALLSRTLRDQIVMDAPTGAGGYRPTIMEVEMRLSQEEGIPFKFEIAEWTMDIPDAYGVYTRQRYIPTNQIAAIPTGRTVGTNKKVKQYKAMDLASMAAMEKVGYDNMGVLITPIVENDNKSLKVLGSILEAPVPDEYRVFVQKGA